MEAPKGLPEWPPWEEKPPFELPKGEAGGAES